MRIRKNASKLLGSTSVHANPWPPPPPACDVTGIVCELNCSPWDVMLIDNLPNSTCSSSSCSLTNPKGEDEGGGILGNLLKTEVEEPISAIASTAADLTIKATIQTDEKKIKKLERKKSKGKEKAATEAITLCKKNDGKGWHCKRPAQLPHSFCSYHLAQTRSYSSSHRATSDHASEAATAAETRAEGGDSNNLYYYYDGFGPWRGKRRGRPVIRGNKVKEEVEEDGTKSMKRDDDDDDNVVAGDDEYDLDCFDEDEDEDEDDNDCYSMPHQNNYKETGKKRGGEELEKKRVVKKRGRKPLKSRSLKSLL